MSSVHTPRYREFLRRLRRAREDAGLTQDEAAALLKKPQSYLSKCESGKRRADVVELAEFAGVYSKDLGFFVPVRRRR